MSPDLGNDKFSVNADERIKIQTGVDKPPCDVSFDDPPKGGVWENTTRIPPCDQREFVASHRIGDVFSFDVECDGVIAPGDPDPVTHYTLTFTH